MPDANGLTTIEDAVPVLDFYKALPKQLAFHQSTARHRLMIGGFGSGKTLALLMEAVLTCLMVPSCNVLILRTTSPDIQKTVINKFLNTKIVPRNVYKSYNKNEKIAYFHNGSQLHFGYCQHEDDINQFLSTEYAFVGLEEAGEFSFRVFEALIGRLRTSSEVRDLNGNPVLPSIGLTTNPFGNGYAWIKQLFGCRNDGAQAMGTALKGMKEYDPQEYFYNRSKVEDNPYTYTPAYVKTLEGMTGTMRAHAREGDLETVGGQMYPQFNTGLHEGVHVMDADDITFQSWQSCLMGSDWDHANWPVLWMTKGLIDDQINGGKRMVNVIYREQIFEPQDKQGHYVEGGSLNSIDVADRIAQSCEWKFEDGFKGPYRTLGHGKPKEVSEKISKFVFSWERFKRNDGQTTIANQLGDRLQKYRMPRPTASQHRREDGWAFIGQLLDRDELVITNDCPNLIAALPTLIRDTPADPGDIKKIESVEDDLADALRYVVSSLMPGKAMPQAEKDAMALAAIEDPVARRIRAYELYMKRQDHSGGRQPRILPWQVRK